MPVGRGHRAPSLRRAGMTVSTTPSLTAPAPTTPGAGTITDLVGTPRADHLSCARAGKLTDPTVFRGCDDFSLCGAPRWLARAACPAGYRSQPVGDVVEADVTRESVDGVLSSLRGLGIDRAGGVTLETITAPSDAAGRC